LSDEDPSSDQPPLSRLEQAYEWASGSDRFKQFAEFVAIGTTTSIIARLVLGNEKPFLLPLYGFASGVAMHVWENQQSLIGNTQSYMIISRESLSNP
jgi:hypothetical protein